MNTPYVPPHTFDSLYRYHRHRIPGGSFIEAIVRNDALDAARRADDLNRKSLADIIIFNNTAHGFHQACIATGDFSNVDLKWETWRMRFSPDATEIRFDRGDDSDE